MHRKRDFHVTVGVQGSQKADCFFFFLAWRNSDEWSHREAALAVHVFTTLGRALEEGRDVLWSFRAASLVKRVCTKCITRRMSLGRAEGSSTAKAINADKSQSASSRKGGRVHSVCSSMEGDAGRRVGRRPFVA